MAEVFGEQLVKGIWWPTDIKETAPQHALEHVTRADFAISMAKDKKSIAIQAGGNMGLWPLRMAPHFHQVHTFEPDSSSFYFLEKNTQDVPNIIRYALALGAERGACSILHKSLGSHQVREGHGVDVHTIDAMFPQQQVGLIQLDVEGYELKILEGARETIQRCKPVVQVELIGFGEKYGSTDDDVHRFLTDQGYDHVHAIGRDFVFWS